MKKTLLSYSLAALFIGSAPLVYAANADSETTVHSIDGMPFTSGGVGIESIDRLNSRSSEFNLKLVFALSSGEYVSGVKVVVRDAKGKPLLDTSSEGPWFMARLPDGIYQIAATLSGKTVNRRISVGEEKLRVVNFRWASE